MAITENGPAGQHKGRLGNIVYYMLNGKNVSRKIGVHDTPFTEGQLKQQLVTKLRSKLFKSILEFINTGFSADAILHLDNAFNRAVKHNPHIITGTYPDLEIAYDQVLLSKGTLKPAQNWKVTATETRLQFTWDTDPQMAWPDANDQVMLMAYFPELKASAHNLFGNTRLSGSDSLEIPPSLQGNRMETYMAFISADRKRLSDSIYTGRFNAETPKNNH